MDEPKRLANLDKHGLDFADFETGFSFDRFDAFPARPSRTGRRRFKLVGSLFGETVVVAVIAPLGSESDRHRQLAPCQQQGKERL